MIASRGAVKRSHADETNRPKGGGADAGWLGQFLRHKPTRWPGWLEGWALIVPSVGLAVIAAAIAVPRATAPKWVPQPLVHPGQLSAELQRTAGLAARARAHPLPYDVRELGELYRRLGRTQYESVLPVAGFELRAWQDRLRTVHSALGSAPVLQLRALQCELLVLALRRWQMTGLADDDLIELGGDIATVARASRWSLTDAERWALALKRWTMLAGLAKHHDFAAPRDLELTQLHFFYVHPEGSGEPLDVRTRILKRYGMIDPTYPVDYALGVLLALNGRPDTAVTYFARHLEEHPDGAFLLRARNHLIWAARQLSPVGNERHF